MTSLKKPEIVSTIERDGVQFKKQGRHFWALCPLPGHKERTPSFKVDPDRQSFYCFGCKRSGDVITYVQELHGLSFKEALAILGIEKKPLKSQSKALIDTTERRKELLTDFRLWERETRNDIAYILRVIRHKINLGLSEDEIDLWAPLIHEIDYLKYIYEILCSNDDEIKIEIYREEIGGEYGE